MISIVITSKTFLFFRHWKSYESIHNPVIKVYCITCTLVRTSRQPKRALASLPYLTARHSFRIMAIQVTRFDLVQLSYPELKERWMRSRL